MNKRVLTAVVVVGMLATMSACLLLWRLHSSPLAMSRASFDVVKAEVRTLIHKVEAVAHSEGQSVDWGGSMRDETRGADHVTTVQWLLQARIGGSVRIDATVSCRFDQSGHIIGNVSVENHMDDGNQYLDEFAITLRRKGIECEVCAKKAE